MWTKNIETKKNTVQNKNFYQIEHEIETHGNTKSFSKSISLFSFGKSGIKQKIINSISFHFLSLKYFESLTSKWKHYMVYTKSKVKVKFYVKAISLVKGERDENNKKKYV